MVIPGCSVSSFLIKNKLKTLKSHRKNENRISPKSIQKSWEFIWLLSMMIENPMNRYDRFPKTLGIHKIPGPYVFTGMKKLCNPMNS